MIVALNRAGEITLLNRKGYEILGYEEGELIGKDWFHTCLPEDIRSEIKEYFIELMAGKVESQETFENEILRKDGDRRIVRWLNTLLKDDSGNITGLLSSGEDVSEWKKAEAALDVKNLVFDVSIAANSISDTEGIIVQANKAFLQIWGYSSLDEVIGKPIAHFLNDEKEAQKIVGAIDRDGRWEGIYHAKRKDGSIFFAQGLATNLVDQNGKLIGYQSSVLDISEKRKAEEEMQKLAAVVRFSSELINLATTDGNMIFLNEAGREMLGIDSHEIENINIMEVIPEHLKQLVQDELLPTLMKGGVWTGDLQYLNLKTKKLTDVQATTFSIKDPEKEDIQFLANVSIDISERKKVEIEVLKLKEGLEEQVAEKTGELLDKNRDLQRFVDATVDRELRMKDLFDENAEMKRKLEKNQKYGFKSKRIPHLKKSPKKK